MLLMTYRPPFTPKQNLIRSDEKADYIGLNFGDLYLKSKRIESTSNIIYYNIF